MRYAKNLTHLPPIARTVTTEQTCKLLAKQFAARRALWEAHMAKRMNGTK
jgi:hypothetical protein